MRDGDWQQPADAIRAKRRAVHERYHNSLSPVAKEWNFQVMELTADRASAYNLFHELLPDRDQRNDVLEFMGKQGVRATFHYLPLHSAVNTLSHEDLERVVAVSLSAVSATSRI